MRWYSHLYVGEKAGKRRFSIIQGIREGKLQPEVYVITPPQNGNNILDIYPAPMLLLPPTGTRIWRFWELQLLTGKPWR